MIPELPDDSTPTPEEQIATLAAERDHLAEWRQKWEDRAYELEAERDAIQSELDALQVKYTDLAFEADAMRAVVDAACDQYAPRGMTTNSAVSKQQRTREAVEAFRAAQQETSE